MEIASLTPPSAYYSGEVRAKITPNIKMLVFAFHCFMEYSVQAYQVY